MRKYFLIFLLFASCITPYDFNTGGDNRLVVVEGYVSNNRGDSEIRLSYSGEYGARNYEWITNAQVTVIENDMDEYIFKHTASGIYEPVDEYFTAGEDNTYVLRLSIEGKVYESEPVTLPYPLDIDEVSYESTTVTVPGDPEEHHRLKLLLTSSEDPEASRYYLYTVEETWLTVALEATDTKIKPVFVLDDNKIPVNIEFEIDTLDNSTYCWPTIKSVGINTATTEGLASNQLVEVPVFYVNLESERLIYKYSANINQYAIDNETHHYFSLLKEFSENEGSLYDIQPGFIDGNIHSRELPEESVIGRFFGASHSEYRMFISFEDLSDEDRSVVYSQVTPCDFAVVYLPYLPMDQVPDDILTQGLYFIRDSLILDRGMVISNIEIGDTEEGDSLLELYFSNPRCVDCRVTGSNIEPDFWGTLF